MSTFLLLFSSFSFLPEDPGFCGAWGRGLSRPLAETADPTDCAAVLASTLCSQVSPVGHECGLGSEIIPPNSQLV